MSKCLKSNEDGPYFMCFINLYQANQRFFSIPPENTRNPFVSRNIV